MPSLGRLVVVVLEALGRRLGLEVAVDDAEDAGETAMTMINRPCVPSGSFLP